MSSYSGKGLSLPCKASDLHRNDLMNCGLHSTPALKPLCLQEMARVLGKEHLLARVRPGSPGQGVFLSTRSLPSAAPISCMILSLALSSGRTPFCTEGVPEAGRTCRRSEGYHRGPHPSCPTACGLLRDSYMGACAGQGGGSRTVRFNKYQCLFWFLPPSCYKFSPAPFKLENTGKMDIFTYCHFLTKL